LIATRGLRARGLAEEPQLAAYTLDAEDPLREAALRLEPEYALVGLVGKPLGGAEDLRVRSLASAAGAALRALRGLSEKESDRLRADFIDHEPDAVLASLAFRDDPVAWTLRERAWSDAQDDARAHSLMGCVELRSAELREVLFERNPVLGLTSLRGTATARGDVWLRTASEHAPKLVLAALAGRSDAFAYELRDALFETGREVVDTVRRLADERAFALRERALGRWPSTVAHSLLGLPMDARVRNLTQRCRAAGAHDLHVLRRLTLLEEQTQRPSWAEPKPLFDAADSSNDD
jgi:hypothetical protein